MSAEPIIYGLIFVGVLVLVEGLYLVAFGKSISLNSRVNRRLEMLEKGAGREEVLAKLRKEMQQHMKSRTIPLYSLLADKAQKAAIAFSPKQLMTIMAGLAAVAFVGLSIGTETETARARPAVHRHWRRGGVFLGFAQGRQTAGYDRGTIARCG